MRTSPEGCPYSCRLAMGALTEKEEPRALVRRTQNWKIKSTPYNTLFFLGGIFFFLYTILRKFHNISIKQKMHVEVHLNIGAVKCKLGLM